MRVFKSYLAIIIALFVSIVLFLATIKGDIGKPLAYQLGDHSTIVGGPFESSGSTSRYALTESLVEQGSIFLTDAQAKFASPDLVYHNGKFFTIFTPGVSFLGIPLYQAGKLLGAPQIGAYATVTLFGIMNIFLVASLARRLGATRLASMISGLTFGFATNAFAYALTYTQHTMSATVIVLALLLVSYKKQAWHQSLLLSALFGVGMLLDIPNVFLLLPVMIYAFFRHVHVKKTMGRSWLTIQLGVIALILGMVPFLALFSWYNHELTSSYTQLGQFIGRTDYESAKLPQEEGIDDPYGVKLPFNTRLLVPGSITLLFSDERSWLYFSPVVLLGIIGAVLAYRQKSTKSLATVMLSVVTVDILLYAMFPDPWGGWSFGARYLIPGAAVLTAFLPVVIDHFRRNIIFIVIFAATFTYSAFINVVGALTTSQVPPKHEVVGEGLTIPWTYAYNFQLLEGSRTSSLLYNVSFWRVLSTYEYAIMLTVIVTLTVAVLFVLNSLERRKSNVH